MKRSFPVLVCMATNGPCTPALRWGSRHFSETMLSRSPVTASMLARGRSQQVAGNKKSKLGSSSFPSLKHLHKISADIPEWTDLQEVAGHPVARVFTARERLFDSKAPELKFWHDAAGWCPHCMTAWTVLEEMRIPYIMETSPLRAYLKPGEKKPASLRKVSPKGVVPIVQFLDKSRSTDDAWVFQAPVKNVGRGEQVCHMLAKEFPSNALATEPRLSQYHFSLFQGLQDAYRPYKYLPNGKPTWAVNPKHTAADKTKLIEALDALEDALPEGPRKRQKQAKKKNTSRRVDAFLFGDRPGMYDMMLLPYLERIEALLLHPFLGGSSGLLLENWPRVSTMLETAREPGFCSFGELSSDAETLLAISMRDDGARLPEHNAKQLVSASEQGSSVKTLRDAAVAAAHHSVFACKDAASRICVNHANILRFSCIGRGCGRGQEAVEQARERYRDSTDKKLAVEIAIRCVVKALLINEKRQDVRVELLETESQSCACNLDGAEDDVARALHFLSQNIGVPRDMSLASAAALRAHLKLFVAALKLRMES